MNGNGDLSSSRKVALILPDLRGGGAERVALALADHFISAGDEVDIVLLGSGGELLPLVPECARVIELKASRFRGALLGLVHFFRTRRPDSTQALMWPVTVLAVIAHRIAGKPGRLVLSEHGTLSKHYRASRPKLAALKATARLFYPAADARICVSHGTAEDIAAISGMARDRFEVIYNPVALPKQATVISPEIESLWPKGGRRILAVGSLKPDKNHRLLLKAFALVHEEEPAALMILGEGPLRSELEQLTRTLGIADRVVMPGFFLDPWAVYASADLFVLSSDHEGYPLVLLEALHSALPVVSTDSGSGPSEILGGGRYGKLTPVGDARALAHAMRSALDKPVAPDCQRARALELAEGACAAHQAVMFGNLSGHAISCGRRA
jgi:glycosyltransferase involved in cell wall biosynthesis